MNVSRPASWFLVLAGLFNIVIWPRFAAAVVDDGRAWSGDAWSSAPTSFLWVHAALIVTAVLVGLGILYVGGRAVLQGRRQRSLDRG